MTPKTLDQHIEITPGVAGGKPRITGHRITVQDIVLWHERLGKTVDEIAAEHKTEGTGRGACSEEFQLESYWMTDDEVENLPDL